MAILIYSEEPDFKPIVIEYKENHLIHISEASRKLYAICLVIGAKWPEAEPTIMQNPEWAYHYAKYVIKGRWPEAESIIKQDPGWAYYYAVEFIKTRWPEAEPVIKQDPSLWEEYCDNFNIQSI